MNLSHSPFLLGALLVITLILAIVSFWPESEIPALEGEQGVIGDNISVIMVSPSMTPSKLIAPNVSPSVSPRMSPSLTPTFVPTVSPLEATFTPRPTPRISLSPTPVPTPVSSPSPTVAIVINEIGWMGTKNSASDEWIELYNPSDQSVSLDDWILYSETDDSPHITLQGQIQAWSFYLIERTDDSVIADISADLAISFGKGGLKNEGERLILKDKEGKMMDEVDCSSSWFAGDNISKISMERIDLAVAGSNPENWRSNSGEIITGKDKIGNAILGTPRAKNSVSQ